ncbi:hypothetical protein A2U01_0080570, partial [Trifolium medium]|nr:hypothetical protein [Trifolium medium]
VAQSRLATGSDDKSGRNVPTDDNWRRLATPSPPPRQATSGDLKNGDRRHLATDTQNRAFVAV